MIYNAPTLTRRVRRIAAVPSQSGTLTYSGSAQSPAWSNYDPNAMTLGGTASGTNAGSYTATFTPKPGYTWADGSTAAKNVGWTIGKAAGSITVSPSSLSLDSDTPTKTITVTRTGTGAISATSSNTGIATVSVSGNKVAVTGKAAGNATITIKVAADANHTAAHRSVKVTMRQMVTIRITGKGREGWIYAEISEVKYYSKASVRVAIGTTVTCYIRGSEGSSQYVIANGTIVASSSDYESISYRYTVVKEASIDMYYSTSGNFSNIEITEET